MQEMKSMKRTVISVAGKTALLVQSCCFCCHARLILGLNKPASDCDWRGLCLGKRHVPTYK